MIINGMDCRCATCEHWELWRDAKDSPVGSPAGLCNAVLGQRNAPKFGRASIINFNQQATALATGPDFFCSNWQEPS